MRFERPLLLLVLLPAIAALLVVSAQRSWVETRAYLGVVVAGDDGALRVAEVVDGSPADRANLRSGERLLAVGGHPVRTRIAAMDRLERVVPGESVGTVVLRDGLPESVVIQSDGRRTWSITRVVSSAVALAFLLGAAAAFFRPREGLVFRVYAAWCIAGALVLGVSWSHSGSPLDWGLYWIDRAARLAFPALWIHLALLFRRRPEGRSLRWAPVVYAPAVALLFAELHVVALGSAMRSADPIALVDMLQSRIELVWLLSGLLAGAAVVYAGARASDLVERARSRWLLAGLGLAALPLSVLTLLPRIAADVEPSWSWAGIPFLALMPLMFTGAVLDYRLIDLALFVRRSLELVTVIALCALSFLGLSSIANALLPRVLDPPGMVPALFAGVLTLLIAPGLREAARSLVGRAYYRKRYNFRRALRRVARDLNAQRDLPELARVLQRRVTEALDAGGCRLLLVGEKQTLIDPERGNLVRDLLSPAALMRLADGETISLAMIADAPRLMPTLHNEGMQVLVPLRVEDRLIAALAVGPRRGAGLLDSDDLDLVRSIAAHAAAAVAGAQHLAELRSQVELVQQLQKQQESLIQSSPMGMAVVQPDGRIRHWNRAAEAMLGASASSVLGKDYASALPQALVHEVAAVIEEAVATGLGRIYRLRYTRPDGSERLLDLSSAPLSGASENDGVLLTWDDVTERVEMEEQLIQQDRLASVGLLAAGVAHEVNTPLTGISSYAQMLLEETGPQDPRRALLEKIVSQAGRASHIARGLLHISRPSRRPDDAGTKGALDLVELLDETLSLLGLQITRSGARIEREIPPGRTEVWGDRARLQQVMMNLLLNALDAISPGGRVVVRIDPGAEGSVQLEVEDDGVGIPDSIRDRVFDPFFTTKGAGRGTGLGLSISYSIVREHGGTMSVESRPGEGTLMRVLLPDLGSAALPERGAREGRHAG